MSVTTALLDEVSRLREENYQLREDLELQRKIDLQIIAEKQQLRGSLSLAEEGLANYAQEVELLWVALKRYGCHTVSCPASGIFSPPEGAPYCTCGFEAVTAVPQSDRT